MRLQHWDSVNGVSEELNAAVVRAATAAEHATDPEPRADFQEAHADLHSFVDGERSNNDEDDE
jgi:hypothetical protein